MGGVSSTIMQFKPVIVKVVTTALAGLISYISEFLNQELLNMLHVSTF